MFSLVCQYMIDVWRYYRRNYWRFWHRFWPAIVLKSVSPLVSARSFSTTTDCFYGKQEPEF